MKLSRALRTGLAPRAALTGAGGKTTALFKLARELPAPVWVTTSTHLGIDQLNNADRHLFFPAVEQDVRAAAQPQAGVTVFTAAFHTGRAGGLPPEDLLVLKRAADQGRIPLLVEADGARTLPLKAPATHEPAIPPWAELVIACAGLSGLGHPLMESRVHRSEIFSRLSGLKSGEAVTPEGLARVLAHPEGGLKGIPSGAKKVVLLNQADELGDLQPLQAVIPGLLDHFCAVLVAALADRPSQPGGVLEAHEKYAAVVLAAGASKRLQRPKQLLTWRGEAMVRRVAKAALAAGCSPVVVVTGSSAAEVEACLVNLPVVLVHNPGWAEGQAASIRKGIDTLPEETGSAFFFLSDQPQIPPDLVRQLARKHAGSLASVTAPRSAGRRVNPVLFDRDTFPDLLKLQGDHGGRALFDLYPVDYLDWDDPALLLDVDTPGDYLTLLEYE